MEDDDSSDNWQHTFKGGMSPTATLAELRDLLPKFRRRTMTKKQSSKDPKDSAGKFLDRQQAEGGDDRENENEKGASPAANSRGDRRTAKNTPFVFSCRGRVVHRR